MGNQQKRSRLAFLANIDSVAQIKTVIDQANQILSHPSVEELFESRISIKLLSDTTRLEALNPKAGFLQRQLWKYYLGSLNFLVVIVRGKDGLGARGNGLEYLEINFLDVCELLEKLLGYVEFVGLTERQLCAKRKEIDGLCGLCRAVGIKIYLPCLHGLCENCFEKWKEKQELEVQCPACGVDIAYDRSFLDGKVFVLENDLGFMKTSFKDQIRAFFKEKHIKWVF